MRATAAALGIRSPDLDFELQLDAGGVPHAILREGDQV
jgi:hypothetical protein